jgi:isopentenyl diphosphate isomerase/L-lactate dehydrogenase-like FMN-dependent dehydrogenase
VHSSEIDRADGADSAPRTPAQWGTTERFVTVREIEAAGRAAIDAPTLNFLEGGAGDESTIAANRRSFDDWLLLPRHVGQTSPPSASRDVLGMGFPVPFFTAPWGLDGAFHPDGFVAVARAHAELGVPFVASRASSRSLEAIAAAAGDCPRMFQMLPVGSQRSFLDLAGRARDAGFAALVITVDAATVGWRERSREDRWQPDHTRGWGNYRRPDGTLDQALLDELENHRTPVYGWDELGELCARTGLPWMPKGVLVADEARRAVASGAAAVYVSNHGGRELDSVPTGLDALVDVAAEVGGEVPVFVDGGVRRGSDVVKAVALGAAAAAWGRPTALALAADGSAGVRRLLELLRDELLTTMTLVGSRSLAELDRSAVRRRTPN